MKDRPLLGRRALVTGAGCRLGQAIALGLAEAGADLAVHYHGSEEGAGETVRKAVQMGLHAQAFQADLTLPSEIDRLFDEVLHDGRPLDLLVNSAANWIPASLEDLTAEMWDQVLDLNLRASFLCSRRAALRMQDAGGGRIINVACVFGFRPLSRYIAYSVSKAGVIMMTRALALALAPTVQVNAVAPGTVLFQEDVSEEYKGRVLARVPAGREGRPEDIVETVLFLATGPSYITGQVIAVDGGRMLD